MYPTGMLTDVQLTGMHLMNVHVINMSTDVYLISVALL
jgi:hypothetical protein